MCTCTCMGSRKGTKHFKRMILKTLLTLLKGTFLGDKSKIYEILMKIKEIIETKMQCSLKYKL